MKWHIDGRIECQPMDKADCRRKYTALFGWRYPKCWHCGAEIGVVKLNSERWTRSGPEGWERTRDTATAIRQSRKECIRDKETDG